VTALEYFIKAIFGLYPRPVSRREYFNLVCDNAALTSALEQKERARVVVLEQNRELQRVLDNTHRTIEAQRLQITYAENVYRVCHIDGQEYGVIAPMDWLDIPQETRARVQVLALCQSRAAARLIAQCLPSAWRDSATYYNPRTNETQWVVIE